MGFCFTLNMNTTVRTSAIVRIWVVSVEEALKVAGTVSSQNDVFGSCHLCFTPPLF